MDIRTDPRAYETFGIGQPILRTEDPQLVRGEGRYTDDINLPGQAYAAIVRSTHAHGVIRGMDTDAARNMPGVLATLGPDYPALGRMAGEIAAKVHGGTPPGRVPIARPNGVQLTPNKTTAALLGVTLPASG